VANILRFVILGDDRGGPAFASFTKQVERANASVDRNNAALKRQSATAAQSRGGIAALAGEVTGFGAAADAASSGGNKFKLALAGINLASGVLEPALAGAVVAAGGLAAAFAAAGAGAAAYGAALKPLLSQTQDVMKAQETLDKARATAQAAYAAAIASGASAKTADAARTRAMTAAQDQYNIAVKGTPGPVREFAKSVTDAKNTYTSWADSLARPVLGPLSMALRLVKPVLTAITPLVRVTAGAFGMLVTEISRKVDAGGLTSVVSTLLPHVRDTILDLGHAAGNVAAGIWGILKAFLPVSGQITGGVVKLTARFKEWGQSLSGGTGFASLMTTFRTETPQALAILTNLGTVIGNVGKAMFGLSTFSNSRLLLSALLPLSGVLATLSKNTDLVRIAMYALLAVKIGQQFTWIPAAAASLVAFAGAAEGATVAQVIAAAATRAWGIAMAALPWVALALAVVAVAVLIIKYHTQIWAFMKRVWNDILGFIMGVWNWIRTHWPLLLAIITGPVGLAILWVVQHFGQITTAVKNVLSAVSTAWNTVWGALKTAFRLFVVNGILGPLGLIVNGAAKAFGWVPGLGSKLKTAAAQFNTFKANVNSALGGINGRTVNVSVAMTSSTNPYSGGISGRKASGGRITGPGGPRSDTAGLYALSNGEWVVRADSAARYGLGAMDAVNRGTAVIGYAAGGPVGVNVKASAPSYKTVESSLLSSVMALAVVFAKAAQAAQAAAGGGVSGAGPAGGDRGTNLKLARSMFPWPASQWPAFNTLEMHEAGYDRFARNSSSGAYGIPQALPPTKMPFAAQAAGGSHAGPQLSWMFAYIRDRYGTPANAWASYYAHPGGVGWYDRGGMLPPGLSLAYNGTGRPEPVGGTDALVAELRALRAEVRQLTGVTAAVPAATGRHVAAGVNGAAAGAAFRGRYPGR
jgi:hypothetical protein